MRCARSVCQRLHGLVLPHLASFHDTIMIPGQASDPLPDGNAPQPRVVPQAPQTDIPHVPDLGAPSTSVRPAVEEPRHVVVSNTNNLRHLRQYFHNNLCDLFVFYLTGSFPWDC